MRIGIDLGGTKISGVLMDDTGRIAARERRESPRGDYRATLAAIDALVDHLARDRNNAPVGIGIPGSISPATGLVKNANSTWLIGHPFDRDLAELLGRPVRIANDADCFALSEASDGAAKGLGTVFGVILGTGVGGGIVVDERPLAGPNAIAGEWGHNPLPHPLPHLSAHQDGPPVTCYCGKRDCIETYLSGPGMSARHAAETGEHASPEKIVAADTPGRAASMARYVDRAARALAHVINILDPHAIVLGGGLSEIETLYQDIPTRWGDYVFSDTVSTPLLKARHGADSGVRGAAWLWRPGESTQ